MKPLPKPATTTPRDPTAAERNRRSRDRARRGRCIGRTEYPPEFVAALVKQGYLDPALVDDPDAFAVACGDWIDDQLDRIGSSF